MNFISSGDYGDIIWLLPALKYFNNAHLFIKPANFTRQFLTWDKMQVLLPLLECQPYINSISEWCGEDGIDCNAWRKGYDIKYNLCWAQLDALNVPHSVADEPWILNVNPKKVAKVVVNRSFRYHGYYPIEVVPKKDAIFIGLKNEWVAFCAEFFEIDFYETKNFLEVAEVIAGSELFVGNNSCCNAIAEGMKHNSCVEVFVPMPNCMFTRKNTKYYIDWIGQQKKRMIRR